MTSCMGGLSLTVTFQGLTFLCVLAHILKEFDAPRECFEVINSAHPFKLLSPNLPFIFFFKATNYTYPRLASNSLCRPP